MDNEEARALARRKLEELRRLPYERLRGFMMSVHEQIVGEERRTSSISSRSGTEDGGTPIGICASV